MLQENKFTTGVNTARETWVNAFNDDLACPEINIIPLYWQPAYSEFDGKQNFKNYKKIGGWNIPYSKMYATTKICGSDFDQIYYE